MLRTNPKLKFCGLSVVMTNPSRLDTTRLLSGNGGMFFNNQCLRPEFNELQIDVRLMEDTSPLLPGTKCILILGQQAMWKWLPETLGQELGAMRGGLFYIKGIPTICSFSPQESIDIKNYETTHNPLSKDYNSDSDLSEDGEDEGDVKTFGRTKRANYSFWLRRDVWKCKQILCGKCPVVPSPRYIIYPSAEEVVNLLSRFKNQFLYLDLETDIEEANLQCFSFSFDGQTIYSVPVLDFNYKWAYTSCHLILRALAIAMRDNTVVAHNGACFDFYVLAHKYHIPIDKTYDTMIAMHRCFPDIEKSLGHCVSYWTYERFHKNEDSIAYRTHQQMMDRLRYCSKDVYTMYLVHQGITSYAKTIPGLETSISDAMKCIKPYLISTLTGIKVDAEKVSTMIQENDRLMFQYNRMIELLIGPQGMKDCRSVIKGKASLIAGSNKQCTEYFHNLLGYKVVASGKPDKFGKKKPSLGKKALYVLALAHDNPVITLICAYRAVAKETTRLRFEPFENLLTTHENIKATNNSSQSVIPRPREDSITSAGFVTG